MVPPPPPAPPSAPHTFARQGNPLHRRVGGHAGIVAQRGVQA